MNIKPGNEEGGRSRRSHFSLLELLIVIAILGALVSLVLPGFQNTGDDAKEKVAMTEMRDAQAAFRRFALDTMVENNATRLEDICKYGLWPLIQKDHPAAISPLTGDDVYSDFDSATGLGRRGPYLGIEGMVKIDATLAVNTGQPESEATGAITIPVIKDPYGKHFRVLCPAFADDDTDVQKLEKLKRLVLVYTGINGKLDSGTYDAIYDANGNFKHLTGDDRTGEIATGTDDRAIRLLPMSSW